MRHKNSGRKLGRNTAHRKALFRNMATAVLTYGRITTTETKAKEIRGVVDPLIALAQQDTLHARREAYRMLGNHKLVKRLFDEIAPEFKGVEGGFTRVVKLAMPRKGDCAPMAIIELTKGKHITSPESKREATEQLINQAKAAATEAVKAERAAKKAAVEPKAAPAEETAAE